MNIKDVDAINLAIAKMRTNSRARNALSQAGSSIEIFRGSMEPHADLLRVSGQSASADLSSAAANEIRSIIARDLKRGYDSLKQQLDDAGVSEPSEAELTEWGR